MITSLSPRSILFIGFYLLIVSFCAPSAQAQAQSAGERQEEVVRNNAALGYNQLAIIQQVGNQNAISINQIGGSANVVRADQNGFGNRGTISVVNGTQNAISLTQDGRGNLGVLNMDHNDQSRVKAVQRHSGNVLDLRIGGGQNIALEISQQGRGYIEIDVPRYSSYRGVSLKGLKIRQENGGVPIVIKPGSTLNLPVARQPISNN